ncbi:MAG: GIN domain-containing protein [Tamlana sp.]
MGGCFYCSSGDFHGFNLQANNTDVSVAGSGDAEVVSKETLKARVSGSGNIVYKGDPKMDTKVAGSGRITNN